MRTLKNTCWSIRKRLTGAESVKNPLTKGLYCLIFFSFLSSPLIAQGIIPKVLPSWQIWVEWKEPHSFGYKYFGNNKTHMGADVKADLGAPVYSFAEGIVVEVFKEGKYKLIGNGILVKYPFAGKHGADLYALYAHFSQNENLGSGDIVKPCQVIGYVGKSGLTYANAKPHLHIELRYFPSIFSPYNPKSVMLEGDYSEDPWMAQFYEDPAEFQHFNEKLSLLPESDIIPFRPEKPIEKVLSIQNLAKYKRKRHS